MVSQLSLALTEDIYRAQSTCWRYGKSLSSISVQGFHVTLADVDVKFVGAVNVYTLFP